MVRTTVLALIALLALTITGCSRHKEPQVASRSDLFPARSVATQADMVRQISDQRPAHEPDQQFTVSHHSTTYEPTAAELRARQQPRSHGAFHGARDNCPLCGNNGQLRTCQYHYGHAGN